MAKLKRVRVGVLTLTEVTQIQIGPGTTAADICRRLQREGPLDVYKPRIDNIRDDADIYELIGDEEDAQLVVFDWKSLQGRK